MLQGHLLKDQLEVIKVQSPNGRARYTIKPLASELSFDKGIYVFIRAVQLLTTQNKDTVVVGLAGPSGSGKTAFSEKIKNFLPGCTILSMDNYNDGSKVIDGNFDDPRITDYDTLLENIKDLKAGRPAEVPIYSFKESKRIGYRTVPVPESRVVVVEGIYALSQRLRNLLDLRVSVTGGVHFDLVKRVLRDIDRSGQAAEEIIQQVSDTVYPMYKAFIEPDLKAAHLRIYNTFNPFSGFMSPTYILKSSKPVDIDTVKSVLGTNASRKCESETYDIYLVPPGEDPETCQSWLRMRYRDGRYNLMFEEWVVEGKFIISPRVTFDVPVRILGGLMALGYEIGTIMQRTSEWWTDEERGVSVKFDTVHGLEGRTFVQVQGKDRSVVDSVGSALGLEGSYVPRSYIEIVQLENLTQSFQIVTEDLKRKFAVNGEPLIDEGAIVGSFSRGSSPQVGSYKRQMGFALANALQRPTLASSAPSSVLKARPSSASSGLLSQHIIGTQPISIGNGKGGSQRSNSAVSDKSHSSPIGSRSPSPDKKSSVEMQTQVNKLVLGQESLSMQMEEIALQLSALQRKRSSVDGAAVARALFAESCQTGGVSGWTSSPALWAAAGVIVGMAGTALLLKRS